MMATSVSFLLPHANVISFLALLFVWRDLSNIMAVELFFNVINQSFIYCNKIQILLEDFSLDAHFAYVAITCEMLQVLTQHIFQDFLISIVA